MKLRILHIVTLLGAFALEPSSLHAEPYSQRLDLQASTVSFDLASQLFSTSGDVKNFSGLINFNSSRLEDASVEFEADVRNVSFAPMPMERLLLIQTLLSSLPGKAIKFRSTSIQPLGNRVYRILGNAVAGGRSERVTLPIQLLEQSENLSRFKGTYERSDSGSRADSPQAVMLGTVKYSTAYDFVFRR